MSADRRVAAPMSKWPIRLLTLLWMLCGMVEAMNGVRGGQNTRGTSIFARTPARFTTRYAAPNSQTTRRPAKSTNRTGGHPILDNQPRDPLKHDNVPLIRLTRDILAPERYDVRIRPLRNHSHSLKIHVSMSLYQLIDVNEPAQFIKMNMWMIQEWEDEMLDWDPREYGMINSTILPHNVIWIPDTYLYNSVVMAPDETERYMNVKATSLFWEGRKGAKISFLYPAIYTITCRLNIRYFPYDQQNCTLTISSWTFSKSALDYYAKAKVNMASFIRNEEWDVISFNVFRHEYKYACCPEPWVILEASIVLRRKPLYYVVNLIIPTSIITLVAITGFFTPASTADDRTEKINLGITTLLAMSILMLMISDQMPTTSDFIPLIAWFYLSIIIIISIGTFLTSVILSIQGRRQYGKLPPPLIRFWFFARISHWLCISIPPPLSVLWDEMNDHPVQAFVNYRKRFGETPYRKQQYAGSPTLPIISDKIPDRPLVPNGSRLSMPDTPTSPPPPLFADLPPRPQTLLDPGSARASANWLRVGSAALKRPNGGAPIAYSVPSAKNSLPMIDVSTPGSPLSAASRRQSTWDSAIATVAIVNSKSEVKDKNSVPAISLDVVLMKTKRQCSLEWEFLATILDRVFLIIFILIVLVVTLGMMLTGRMTQFSYDLYND